MNLNEIIIWLIIIFVSDILAMVLYDTITKMKDKRKEAVLCDICHRPRKLKQTFDKQLWVCQKCNTLYVTEFKEKGE